MQLIGFLLPLVALYAYYNDYMTLFYWTGSIVAVLDIIAILNGSLRCWGTLLTVGCWVWACRMVDSTWEGLILGSCWSFLVVMGLMSITVIPMLLVGFVGLILSPFYWLVSRFRDKEED